MFIERKLIGFTEHLLHLKNSDGSKIMDLLEKIKESLLKKKCDIRIRKIIKYFSDIDYKISWDDGVPENWISIEGNKRFHCLIGVVFPIIFIINSDKKILEKYGNIENEFLIIEIEDYDSDIWEISDINEFMSIAEQLNLSIIKERFLGKFSTHDFWYNTITA